MKKFVLGLFCGVIISTASVASASDTVKTFLTQATLAFHVNGKVNEANAGEVELLTYKDRIYVPLRYFSEQMGATIDYLPKADGLVVPHVTLTYEDKYNFTATDPTKSISIGHVSVDFGHIEDPFIFPPTITGIVTMNKSIPEGKEAVIELQDHNGVTIAQSEFMTPGDLTYRTDPRGTPFYAFKVGEMRPFKVRFPYVSEITDYQVVVKLVDATSWRFKQQGSYAQEDGPFDITLGTSNDLAKPVKKGSTFKITLSLTNTTDHALKIIRAPLEVQVPGSKNIVLDELTNTVIPGNHGSYQVTSEWNVDAEPGQYMIRIKEPIEFQYEEEGTLKDFYNNGDMWTAFPITVE